MALLTRLQDGQVYSGRPTGAASVYENEKGSLVVCVEIEVEGESLRHYATIATERDGVNKKTIENLKEIFGWDGQDPFWFVDNGADYCEREVSVTIELRNSQNGNTYASIQWLNPPGRSFGSDLPQSGNRQALLSKYGSKFRAIAGGAPMKPPAKAPPAPPKKNATPTPSKAQRKSDQMSCWAKYCENGGTDDGWFKMIAEAVPGVDQGDLTPEQWGQVLEHIETNMLPM